MVSILIVAIGIDVLLLILEERGNRNNRKGVPLFHQRRWVHINYSSRVVITYAVAVVVIIIIV